MRDPARIPRILEALRVEWEKQPDLRLGQLLLNAHSEPEGDHEEPARRLFYTEDERIVANVQSFCRPKKTGQ